MTTVDFVVTQYARAKGSGVMKKSKPKGGKKGGGY